MSGPIPATFFEHLRDSGNPDWTALLAQTDVLVDGPFLAKEKSYELHFQGGAETSA